jgi:hypothetical protein
MKNKVNAIYLVKIGYVVSEYLNAIGKKKYLRLYCKLECLSIMLKNKNIEFVVILQ